MGKGKNRDFGGCFGHRPDDSKSGGQLQLSDLARRASGVSLEWDRDLTFNRLRRPRSTQAIAREPP